VSPDLQAAHGWLRAIHPMIWFSISQSRINLLENLETK
jgi:hypothetical protein